MPVRDVRAAVAHREHFGFDAPHETDDFAVLVRDEAVIHLWGATDEDWRTRDDLTGHPICSGAESSRWTSTATLLTFFRWERD